MSSPPTTDDLASALIALAAQMGADPAELPSIGANSGDAEPSLERGPDGLWRWRIRERGELVVDVALPPDRPLYPVAVHLASQLATRSRQAGGSPDDARRRLFAAQYAALQRVEPSWARHWRDDLAAEFARAGQPEDVALLP